MAGRTITALGTSVIALTLATAANADVLVSYRDFSGACSGGSLICVGSASAAGAVLSLTPAEYSQSGAAYSTTPITLGANDIFSTQFKFQFTDAGGVDPADGITFVLSAGTSGLGASGGGMG